MNRAARENPEDATAQFNYGIFLLNSGKTAEAISAFQAALLHLSGRFERIPSIDL